MVACMGRMDANHIQDLVSDFLLVKWEKLVAREPSIDSIKTWENTNGVFSSRDSLVRFFVYRAFVNYSADQWKHEKKTVSFTSEDMAMLRESRQEANPEHDLLIDLQDYINALPNHVKDQGKACLIYSDGVPWRQLEISRATYYRLQTKHRNAFKAFRAN